MEPHVRALLSTLFRRLGYRVEVTQLRGDYGADLVVTNDTKRTAVQAKRLSKRVGVKAVQEAAAAKGFYRCDSALVVADREFTQQAQKLARANRVELWGREVLVSKLLAVRGKRGTAEAARARADAGRARSPDNRATHASHAT
jgi:restriction system protein